MGPDVTKVVFVSNDVIFINVNNNHFVLVILAIQINIKVLITVYQFNYENLYDFLYHPFFSNVQCNKLQFPKKKA